MHRKRRYLVYCVLALIDVALIVSSFLLACILYLGTVTNFGGLAIQAGPGGEVGAAFIVTGYALILVIAYAVSRVYGNTYIGQISFSNVRIVMINTFGLIIAIGLLYLFHLDDVSRATIFIFYVISTTSVCLKTWLSFRVLLVARKNKRRMQNTLVIGSGALAAQYMNAITENTSRFEHIIGYIAAGNGSGRIENISYIGGIASIDRILQSQRIEKVVIALEPTEYLHINAIMAAADRFGVELELVPFYNDIMPRRPYVDSVGSVKLVNLRSMPLANPLNSAVKRVFDVVVSSVIIVLFSWLYIILAIGVKVSSPGPVFFKQRRIGKGNKPFYMLKFRSMRLNDESETAWSTDEDPRKTRFGSFIRKFSLDEFPQFFNVVIGNMSIVGPRPEIPHYVEEFRDKYPRYMLRHQIRPGITGWAQIHGLRGDTPIDKRIDADLWYIEHWSPWLDTKIFIATFFGGFVNSEKVTL